MNIPLKMWDELTLLIHFATYSTAIYGPKKLYSNFMGTSCHSARQGDLVVVPDYF